MSSPRPVPAAVLLSFGLGACAPAPAPAGPTPIVLVSLDTLRADRLGAYGNPDGLTPNLDRFASEAVVFDHVYSQAIHTAPSHGSVFTSRYSGEQITTDNKTVLDATHPTLAQVLGIYGYQTAAYVAGGDLSPERKLGRGFETYVSTDSFDSLYHTMPGALEWLDKADPARPWFLFLHGYDLHSAYLRPAPYGYLHADIDYTGNGLEVGRTTTERVVDGRVHPDFGGLIRSLVEVLRPRDPANHDEVAAILDTPGPVIDFTADDAAHIRDIYDGAVSYADTMFGTFMAGLSARGLLDRAAVVVMSDHGEQLGERGAFGHCCGLEDDETHVVLMVRLPGGAHGGRHEAGVAELVDVLPTLVELAGGRPPADIAGRSLLAAVRGEPFEPRTYAHTEGDRLLREVSVRTIEGRLSYIGLAPTLPLTPSVIASARLDGPGFTATPGLTDAQRGAMRDELVRWLRERRPAPTVTADPTSEALKQEMRAHGYFEAGP